MSAARDGVIALGARGGRPRQRGRDTESLPAIDRGRAPGPPAPFGSGSPVVENGVRERSGESSASSPASASDGAPAATVDTSRQAEPAEMAADSPGMPLAVPAARIPGSAMSARAAV